MSCLENEKVVCCKKFYKKVFSYNENTNTTESTTLIEPIWCASVCPNDCITNTPNESYLEQYVTTIATSCEECANTRGCDINLAIIFNPDTCSLEELFVGSENEATALSQSPKRLVAYIECLSTRLSIAKPASYAELLKQELRNSESCHKPCCYKLENNKTGCIKLSPEDCNNKYLQEKLNTKYNVLESLVISNENSCENLDCFGQSTDENPTAYSVPQKYCGACCINNLCINLCDVDKSNLYFYAKEVLKIDAEFISGIFYNRIGKITARELCSALQGTFKGYNTVCDNNICSHTKIFIK